MITSGMQLRASNKLATALRRAVTACEQGIRNRSFPLVAAVLRSACLTKITGVVSTACRDAKTSKEKGI
jgi:hypothetical protein